MYRYMTPTSVAIADTMVPDDLNACTWLHKPQIELDVSTVCCVLKAIDSSLYSDHMYESWCDLNIKRQYNRNDCRKEGSDTLNTHRVHNLLQLQRLAGAAFAKVVLKASPRYNDCSSGTYWDSHTHSGRCSCRSRDIAYALETSVTIVNILYGSPWPKTYTGIQYSDIEFNI